MHTHRYTPLSSSLSHSLYTIMSIYSYFHFSTNLLSPNDAHPPLHGTLFPAFYDTYIYEGHLSLPFITSLFFSRAALCSLLLFARLLFFVYFLYGVFPFLHRVSFIFSRSSPFSCIFLGFMALCSSPFAFMTIMMIVFYCKIFYIYSSFFFV